MRFEDASTVYWVVCDGFTNLAALPRNPLVKLLTFLYGLRVGLRVTPVYRFNVRDKPGYREWVIQRFSADKRQVLIPCHGQIDAEPNLGSRVIALMKARF